MKFDNTYRRLPEIFYSPSAPFRFTNPKLIVLNEELAQDLDLDLAIYSPDKLAQVFSGQELLPGSELISTVYAAHQFGHFVPILGDGRAILMGEVIALDGRRFDIQLKGAGPTKYSRRGDGFSALGPVLREYLLSEFMHKMGIPTTRALAAVLTNENVYRENILPGGVFTRVAKSHMRIGTFQYFAGLNDLVNLKILLDYAIKRHYPEILDPKNDWKEYPILFLKGVIKAQVDLVSSWMSIGFIHGVMNTDNMSISGETIDYGPCAFMDHFKFDQVYSFIDNQGRYRYSNQPQILIWNLSRLADCLIPVVKENFGVNDEAAIRLLEKELALIKEQFEDLFIKKMSEKLILNETSLSTLQKKELVFNLLEILEVNDLDFTNSFRQLSRGLINELQELGLQSFLNEWREILKNNNLDFTKVASKMDLINPLYIPRNHLVEKIIESGLKGDFSPFKSYLEVLSDPFSEKDHLKLYEKAPNPNEVVANTFCGT